MIGLGGALAAYLLLWPVPADPVAWTPPSAPKWATNDRLGSTEVFQLADGAGPEDVAVDGKGRVHVGLLDGRILRHEPDGKSPRALATIPGGRPLGLAFDRAGDLIVADANAGLLSVSPEGEVTTLSTEHGGVPYRFTNDVDIAADGTVYFTDASHRFGVEHYKLDLLEHRPNGRLLAWDPGTRSTRLIGDGLYFANGVAVSHDEQAVLLAETGTYRILRFWIAGPQRGEREVVIENLPGFPDGISRGTDGIYWFAVASPRDPVIDEVLAPRPWLGRLVLRLPRALMPKPKRHGFVLGIDDAGKVRHDLQDARPSSFSPVTSVEEHGGKLYLGSLSYPGWGRTARP